jgi:hypothetical protein
MLLHIIESTFGNLKKIFNYMEASRANVRATLLVILLLNV